MSTVLLLLAAGLLLVALLALGLAQKQRRSSGLPVGQIIYQDTSQWGKVEKPLYDPVTGLTGKPDYLVQVEDGTQIPVEVKSGRAPTNPYDSHVYQLAAYCFLVEQSTGNRPPYGILRYRDQTFSIPYTEALEEELMGVLDAMREQDHKREVDRSHQEPGRCARCGYRSSCDQRL